MPKTMYFPVEDENNLKKPIKKEDFTYQHTEFLKGLVSTGAKEVLVKIDQVVDLIGEEKANELIIFYRAFKRADHIKRTSRSLIPQEKRFSMRKLASFNRQDLLDAINEVHDLEVKTEPQQFNSEPNRDKVNAARKKAGLPAIKDKEVSDGS